MFIGHFAVGFAAKRWAPRAPLGILILAPLLLDVLWPIFCLLGIERFRIQAGGVPFLRLVFESYPWSHSLLMALVWGAVLGFIYLARSGDGTGARVIGLLVVSHWVLDWISHIRDLPLWPGGPKTGLGLWHSTAGTLAVELAMFVTGLVIYLRATRARDWIGSVGIWGFALLLLGLYALSTFGPPPPVGAERLVSITALIGIGMFPLAWWLGKHRE